MSHGSRSELERRVVRAAEQALAQRKFVTGVDVLMGLGWLQPRRVEEWRQGRVDYLEQVVEASLGKTSTAMLVFSAWARERGLKPSETTYLARGREHRPLRFSKSGDPTIELAYRTHWASPELSEAKRARLAAHQSRPPDLVVISPVKEFTCSVCGTTSGELLMMEDGGPVCMTCAELDHLVFLPAGDAALTRRAKTESCLSAVVVRFSRARGRYERQGVLTSRSRRWRRRRHSAWPTERPAPASARATSNDAAIKTAPCMSGWRGRSHASSPVARPSERLRSPGTQRMRGSGRVGRTAAGRALDPSALELAVVASVRHCDTGYDELLMAGIDRASARERISGEVDRVLEDWRHGRPA